MSDNPLELSDEEFARLNAPVADAAGAEDVPAEEEGNVEEPSGQTEDSGTGNEEQDSSDDSDAGSSSEDGGTSDSAGTDGGTGKTETDPTGESGTEQTEAVADPVGSKKEESSVEVSADDAIAFYKDIMTPFKANGKMIELRSPEEARQLMQMGANYTKKMQELQPHRKMLLMLQNNDLLDENKLSFLIDLDKKNPDAIQKLIKDSGIDPMEIDTTTDPKYSEGNHAVSDQEVNFRTVIEEVSSEVKGPELISEVQARWDQTSKDALWDQPEILRVMSSQYENGIYQNIVSEMDRRITLGAIPPDMPFIQAYKTVGDDLYGRPNQDRSNTTQGQPPVKEPRVVDVRAAEPKNTVNDKAKSASPTRSSPNRVKDTSATNPLAMSDEEFLKSMQGRV